MRMYLFEWTSYNPEAGIKYIHNMSKSQLIQMCLYTEDRLSKDELVDIMIDVKNSLKENKKRLKNKKEDTKYDNSSNANVNKPVNIITINNAPETVYYTADEDDSSSSDNDKDDN